MAKTKFNIGDEILIPYRVETITIHEAPGYDSIAYTLAPHKDSGIEGEKVTLKEGFLAKNCVKRRKDSDKELPWNTKDMEESK